MEVFVARQPIFDRKREIYAYRLLYRSGAFQDTFGGADGATANTQVIGNTLLTIGVENLLCGKKAFINFDRRLLIDGLPAMFPPDILVVELLQSLQPDDRILAVCRQLSDQGFALALDDFVPNPHLESLASLAKLIKVDLLATTRADQERILATYRPRGVAMLAEKVETQEAFEWALSAGYDYFQGFFFARPANLRGQRIPSTKLTCLLLLSEVQKEEPDFARLQTLITRDVWLSYSLLRYVNSALFAHSAEIHSICHAMTVLGEAGMRRWAALAALPEMAKGKPGELVTLSLVRARFCEGLAEMAGAAPPNLGFLMGLFSLLDALTDLPLAEALEQVHAAPVMREALLGEAPPGGLYSNLYRLVCGYEAGDWEPVTRLAALLRLEPARIADAYAESAFWAQQALHATVRKINTRRHVRYAASGELRLLWEDRGGTEAVIQATLCNVSMEGLQLLVSEKIPILSYLRCNEPKLGICTRGRVRYCNYTKGKYLIGLECRGGTGWREPSGVR